jgi:cytochrome c biogenesis protein CcdA
MCKETKEAVRAAEAKFGERIAVEWVDLSDPDKGTASATRLFRMLDEHGVTGTPPLSFFAGGMCLAGGEVIVEELDAVLIRKLVQPGTDTRSTSTPIVTDRLGIWAISAAALADGVNPCAFATVVLLVSMMATARRSRRETLVIGGAFTLSVYITYFLIGLAFYGILQRLRGFLLISDLVFYVAFAACVVFGLLSLWDSTLAWRGREPKDMLLKVPERLRARMARSMSAGVRSRSLVLGAFGAGVVVSLLESTCTGQVYFPVIAGLVRDSGTRARGVALLAWYNVLFVLPLVGILGLAIAGVGSSSLAAWGKRHWGLTKLLMALVFVAMACWMAPGLIWPPGAR